MAPLQGNPVTTENQSLSPSATDKVRTSYIPHGYN